MSRKVIVTGAGLSGLSAAAQLALRKYDVEVFEKNEMPGGRARHFQAGGFTFDMGPTWYWFPGIIDSYFKAFGHRASDFYDLIQMDPSYRIYFGRDDYLDVPSKEEELTDLFESVEKGSSKKLKKLLHSASLNYEVAFNRIIYNSGTKVSDYASWAFIKRLLKYNPVRSYAGYVRSVFKNERLINILEFPIISLGASPEKLPAFYSLMNYAVIKSGTWYPLGGMYEIVKAMLKLLDELHVPVHLASEVENYDVIGNRISGIYTHGKNFHANYFVSSADYYHTERQLSKEVRNYPEKYWTKKQLTPSSVIYFLGINKKLENLNHHNLFYDASLNGHLADIYKNKKWPENPVFYVCCSSRTDPGTAPEGMENLIVNIPVAAGLEDTGKLKEHYYDLLIDRMERVTQQNIRDHVVYKRSYARSDFMTDYHAFLGNAFGLANSYWQTGFLRPKIKNKHLINLYYCGHLTVPGPGIPSSLISGEIAANEIHKGDHG
ncbi:MAG: phytoene desaturase family protein [Bacteroidales bacterium]|jgi:phytoene desaturase